MKKLFISFLSFIFLALLIVAGMAAKMPDDFRVEESILIRRGPQEVFPHVGNLRNWENWSPWKKRDPTVTMKYSGPEAGVGATSEWTSDKSGSGRTVILEFIENAKVTYELTFLEWDSKSNGSLELNADSGGTRVTWSMYGRHGFGEKFLWVLFNFDRAIKKDFKSGLKALRKIVEGKA